MKESSDQEPEDETEDDTHSEIFNNLADIEARTVAHLMSFVQVTMTNYQHGVVQVIHESILITAATTEHGFGKCLSDRC